MNVEIKVCCSSFKQELCEEVEHTLRNQFGAHNVKKDNGIFEHIITTKLNSYDEAENIVDKLREESNGQIALIEYVVTNHK